MPDTNVSLFFSPNEPTPIARLLHPTVMPAGWAMISMPGSVALHGPVDQIRAWLQAALHTLADSTVRWEATEALIEAEHPSVNHARKPIGYKLSDQALCGAEGGNVGAGPATCPLCLQLLHDAAEQADEVSPDAA